MSKEPTTNSQGLSEECHAMISRISHEVRNPVAVIHSFHQLLLLAHPELSLTLYTLYSPHNRGLIFQRESESLPQHPLEY